MKRERRVKQTKTPPNAAGRAGLGLVCEAITEKGLKEGTFELSSRINRKSQGKEPGKGTPEGEEGIPQTPENAAR